MCGSPIGTSMSDCAMSECGRSEFGMSIGQVEKNDFDS
jgi:hypothetical protein